MKAASWISVLTITPLLLFLSTTSSVRPAAAQPELNLTKWKLEASATSYGGGIGIYRRVGRQWDLGLLIDGSVSTGDRNDSDRYLMQYGPALRSSTGHDDDFSINLNPELRRWSARTDRLKMFWGLRATAGYGWSDSKRKEYDLSSATLTYETIRSTTLSHNVGTGLLFGAEWQVSPHLGLAARLNPVTIHYYWDRSSNERWRADEGEVSRHLSHSNHFSADWRLLPALVASINF